MDKKNKYTTVSTRRRLISLDWLQIRSAFSNLQRKTKNKDERIFSVISFILCRLRSFETSVVAFFGNFKISNYGGIIFISNITEVRSVSRMNGLKKVPAFVAVSIPFQYPTMCSFFSPYSDFRGGSRYSYTIIQHNSNELLLDVDLHQDD
ncbi:hypothetical protein BDD12DRAFT_92607 [Trichophaea hybrida]|nr:hypothetical protein BDD12DRAFT_92607 [Trichophaea hybrida]